MSRYTARFALAAALAVAVGCASEEPASKPAGPGAGAASGSSAPAEGTPALVQQGEKLYTANCISCHGESGKGDGPAAAVLKPPPRDHTDRAYMSTLSDKDIADIIKMGGAIRGKPLMPSHPQFKEQELNALVAYVRSLSEPSR